jgi:hypothetical protein
LANIRERRVDLKPNRRASNLAANAEKELIVTAVSFSTRAGRAYAVLFGTPEPLAITARTLTDLVAIIEIIVRAFWSTRAYVAFWWRHAGMTHEEFRAWDRENRAMTLRIWPDCEA